jgi:hypothetical protein
MKRILLIASFIGLFMVTGLDLQARHSRNYTPRHVRNRISFSFFSNFQIFNQHDRYGRYDNRQDRHVGKEIRKNEKRIYKLEKRIDRLDRRGGNYREIRELEYEIAHLQRRNDFLRNRLY